MTPYQQLAAFGGADGRPPTPAWARTAPVLRAWAATAGGSDQEQGEAICAHMVRVWSGPALALVPYLATRAAALRAAPCAADWAETVRIAGDALAGARFLPWGIEGCIVENDAWSAARDAVRQAALDAGRFEAEDATWAAADLSARAAAGADAGRRLNALRHDAAQRFRRPPGDPWPQATEEWVLLAEANALAVLPPHLRGTLDEPGAYAVVWDWLAARGDAAGGTDDGARVCGLPIDGAPLPDWARKTALIRCLLRVRG